ncbi:MAG: MFS transporter [Candidatus Bathyarchaeia archaeon]
MLFLGWLVYFSFGMVSSSLAPLVSFIRDELNLTYSQFGTVLGAWPLTYIAVSFLEGMLIDRIGIRKSITLGVLFLSMSALLRSAAWDYATLFTAVAIFGLGGPMISIGLPKLIAGWFSGRERGTATGIYITGSTLGMSFSLALTNSLILPLAGNWRNTCIAYGVAAFLIAALWLVAAREAPENISKNENGKASSTGRNYSAVIKHRDVWLVVIIGFSGFMTGHGLKNWLPQIYELNGMTASEAGFLASVPTIVGALGSIIINRTAARLTSRKTVMIVLLAISSIGIYLVTTLTGPVVWAIAVVYGFCSGALLPLLMLVLMEMRDIGQKLMGTAGGLFFTIGELGGFSGPTIMGYLKDHTGTFIPSVVMLSVINGIMILPALVLDERRT